MDEKKIWETKEFRDARKEWEEGKRGDKKDKCECCGSTEALTPHHIISFRQLIHIMTRKLIAIGISKERGCYVYPSSIDNVGGFNISKDNIKCYVKKRMLNKYLIEHPEIKEMAETLAKEEYLTFNNTETLCPRCHFAGHKGMELCPYCKKNYYKPGYYDSCSNPKCKEKAEKDYKKFEEEMDRFEDESEKKAQEYFKSNKIE